MTRWLGDRNGSHVSRRKVVGCQSSASTWVLSGGFAARSSTHCYTSIMGSFIAAVSCSILWSNLIFFVNPATSLYYCIKIGKSCVIWWVVDEIVSHCNEKQLWSRIYIALKSLLLIPLIIYCLPFSIPSLIHTWELYPCHHSLTECSHWDSQGPVWDWAIKANPSQSQVPPSQVLNTNLLRHNALHLGWMGASHIGGKGIFLEGLL